MTGLCRGENVLMVLGGQFFNASSRLHDMVHQVEVLGPRASCQVAPLPSPLYGLTAARLGEKVVACGGFHQYYRSRALYSEKIARGQGNCYRLNFFCYLNFANFYLLV